LWLVLNRVTTLFAQRSHTFGWLATHPTFW
jgi:hypothetical protein